VSDARASLLQQSAEVRGSRARAAPRPTPARPGVHAAPGSHPDPSRLSSRRRPCAPPPQVEYDEVLVSAAALAAAVEDAGFDASVLEVGRAATAAGAGGAAAFGGGGGCDGGGEGGGGEGAAAAAAGGGGPQVARIAVGGMTCAACSAAVERALAAVPGVQRAGVALTAGEAEVRGVRWPRKTRAGSAAGVRGRWRGGCRARRCVAGGAAGGPRATVSVPALAPEPQAVFDAGVASAEQLVAAVEDAGFDARLISMGGARPARCLGDHLLQSPLACPKHP
jgi:copper chaperone CopZ